MIIKSTIKERGATPRGFRRAFGDASKQAWVDAGVMWHTTFRDKRFTPEHARKAGYTKRRGEESGTSGKEFWKSYTGQKLKKWHHKNPLQWSGETRRKIATASITSTATRYAKAGSSGGGVRIAYPGARKFNFKHPKSQVRMADEFRRIIPEEAKAVAELYDDALDRYLEQSNNATTTRV